MFNKQLKGNKILIMVPLDKRSNRINREHAEQIYLSPLCSRHLLFGFIFRFVIKAKLFYNGLNGAAF
jgi:hypothetical protein